MLSDTLELVDLDDGGGPDHAVRDEHWIACQAISAVNRSVLGPIV